MGIGPDIEAVELLDDPRCRVQTFPLSCRADDLQLFSRWELFLELLVHLLSQLGKVLRLVLDEAEGVLCQRVQHVQAVDLVSLRTTFRVTILSVSPSTHSITFAMGRSKETMARLFGFGIPKGGSKLPMKSDIWLNVMNWVACGSNLLKIVRQDD